MKSVSDLRRSRQFCFVSNWMQLNGSEEENWRSGLRSFYETTSLDRERLPSLWAKLCLCIDRRIRGNWKEETEWMASPGSHRLQVNNRAIDTCMAFFSLISLSDSSGNSSVLHSKRGNQAQGLNYRNDMYILISVLHCAFNLMVHLLCYTYRSRYFSVTSLYSLEHWWQCTKPELNGLWIFRAACIRQFLYNDRASTLSNLHFLPLN